MRYTGVDEFLYNGSLKSENTFIKKKKKLFKKLNRKPILFR